jgi:hypothetical protein
MTDNDDCFDLQKKQAKYKSRSYSAALRRPNKMKYNTIFDFLVQSHSRLPMDRRTDHGQTDLQG